MIPIISADGDGSWGTLMPRENGVDAAKWVCI